MPSVSIHPFSITTSPGVRVAEGAGAYHSCLWAINWTSRHFIAGATQRKNDSNSHLRPVWSSQFALTCVLLDCGRKSESQSGHDSYADTVGRCKLQRAEL